MCIAGFVAARERVEREAGRRAERERLFYAVPESNEARLIIRYETMLTRGRDRAVKELDRLKTWGE